MSYVIPDPRWEEPNLLVPGKKPVGKTTLNISHLAFSPHFRPMFIGESRPEGMYDYITQANYLPGDDAEYVANGWQNKVNTRATFDLRNSDIVDIDQNGGRGTVFIIGRIVLQDAIQDDFVGFGETADSSTNTGLFTGFSSGSATSTNLRMSTGSMEGILAPEFNTGILQEQEISAIFQLGDDGETTGIERLAFRAGGVYGHAEAPLGSFTRRSPYLILGEAGRVQFRVYYAFNWLEFLPEPLFFSLVNNPYQLLIPA